MAKKSIFFKQQRLMESLLRLGELKLTKALAGQLFVYFHEAQLILG